MSQVLVHVENLGKFIQDFHSFYNAAQWAFITPIEGANFAMARCALTITCLVCKQKQSFIFWELELVVCQIILPWKL